MVEKKFQIEYMIFHFITHKNLRNFNIIIRSYFESVYEIYEAFKQPIKMTFRHERIWVRYGG